MKLATERYHSRHTEGKARPGMHVSAGQLSKGRERALPSYGGVLRLGMGCVCHLPVEHGM